MICILPILKLNLTQMTHSFPKDAILLAPSLLAANQSALGVGVDFAQTAGVKCLHLDIMDGHFVPNISLGPDVVQCLRKKSDLFFDAHLMLSNPNKHYESFIRAGADLITIHVEPEYPIEETINGIKDYGVLAGIAINPETDVDAVMPFLKIVDLVLVMTVHPGFGGQKFIHSQVEKTKKLRQIIGDRPIHIEIDGGVTTETAPMVTKAGADVLVVGSAVFKGGSAEKPEIYGENIRAMRSAIRD